METNTVGLLDRLLGRNKRIDLTPLWFRTVMLAREPQWFNRHGVSDTIEGRFDMVATATALVLIRLEREGLAEESARLTEHFIDDMDAQLREAGVGDLVVGKHMGKLVSALGGRIGAYRDALAQPDDAALAAAAKRNITLQDEAGDALGLAGELRKAAEAVDRTDIEVLLSGKIER